MRLVLPLAILAGATSLSAQSADDASGRPAAPLPRYDAIPRAEEPATQVPRSASAIGSFRTRIHTAADDPEGGAYGIWGGGTDYKVSFHDGFTFVPYLGKAYPHNQPWSWKTVAVTRGGQPVAEVGEAPTRAQDDYRYEYRYGGVTEAYDVLENGAEQTFVFAQRPPGAGDLIVTGTVATQLRSTPVENVVADLVFADAEGREILRYGKATAIDAAGNTTAVRTSYDGQQIRLVLDGKWVDEAAYPLVIDPLLTRESIGFWNTLPVTTDGAVTATAVGRDDDHNQPCIAYIRDVSATDSDLYVWLFDNDTALRSERHQIFVDQTASWGDASVNVATVGGAVGDERWVIAFVRIFSATSRGARMHPHVLDDLTSNTTVLAVPQGAASVKVNSIDVGGRNAFDSSDVCMLVYDRNQTNNSDNIAVFGRTWSTTGGFGAEVALSQSGWPVASYTNMWPKINQVTDQTGNDGWFVVWQAYWETRPTPDEWDVVGRRVDETGAIVGGTWVSSRSIPDTAHQLAPDVAGQSGKYAVTYAEWTESPLTRTTSTIGGEIYCDRVNWPVTGSNTTPHSCEITQGFVNDRRWRNDALAFDDNSRSHWCAVLSSTGTGSQYVEMLGYDAGMTERATASTTGDAVGGAVTYNNDTGFPRGEFLLSYGTDEGSAAGGVETHPVYSHRFEHIAETPVSIFGPTCGGNIGATGRILRGSDSFNCTLTGGPPSTFAACFVGFSAIPPTPAPFLNPGCRLNIGSSIGSVTAFTSGSGAARVDIDFPACSFLLTGTIYFQWLWLTPIAIGSSEGMRIDIN